MKEQFISLLDPVSRFFYQSVMQVPLAGVKWIFLGTFVVLMVWVWRLPGEAPNNGLASIADLGRDLRIWAFGILLLQIVIYLILS